MGFRAEERSLEMSLANDDFLEAPPLENADFIHTDASEEIICMKCGIAQDASSRVYFDPDGGCFTCDTPDGYPEPDGDHEWANLPYGSEPCSFCDPRRDPLKNEE